MASASDRQAVIFRLSGGHAHDAPEGRALLESRDAPVANATLDVMFPNLLNFAPVVEVIYNLA